MYHFNCYGTVIKISDEGLLRSAEVFAMEKVERPDGLSSSNHGHLSDFFDSVESIEGVRKSEIPRVCEIQGVPARKGTRVLPEIKPRLPAGLQDIDVFARGKAQLRAGLVALGKKERSRRQIFL